MHADAARGRCLTRVRRALPRNRIAISDTRSAPMKISALRCASTAAAQDLFAQITSVSGTSVTLSIAPAQTGSFTMRHDDSVPINAAISSICSHTATGGTVGGIVEFPATSAYPLGQSISLYGCWGVTLSLTGAQNGDGGHPVELEWHGVTGGTVINMNKAADSRVAGLSVSGINGNTAGVIIDVDNYTTGGAGDGLADAARYVRARGPGPRGHRDPRRESIHRQRTGPEFQRRADLESLERAGRHVGLLFRRRRPDLQRGNPRRPDRGSRHRDHVGLRRTARDLWHRLRAEQGRRVDHRSFRRRRGRQHDVFRRDQRERAEFHFRRGRRRSNFIIEASRIADSAGTKRIRHAVEPADRNHQLVGLRRRNDHLRNQQRQWRRFGIPIPIFSMQNSFGDPSPFRDGTGSNTPDRLLFTEFADILANTGVRFKSAT